MEPEGEGVQRIAMLVFDETVRLDSDRLAELYEQLGQNGAQDVVCRAMEELSIRLARIDESFRAYKLATLHKSVKGLIGIAEQVGMQRLADVARDVCNCAAATDPVALGATMARLQRIGDVSLTAVWDLQGMSV